jgi:hypothetical protein
MKSRHVPEGRALTIAKEQLDLLQFDKVDPRQVLMETAQFFGVFVPSEEGWEFVHRTLHDFLAAQFGLKQVVLLIVLPMNGMHVRPMPHA